MTITEKKEGKKLTLSIEGWLDVNTSEQLAEKINEIKDIDSLELDFSGLEYISSAGIRQIVSASKKAGEVGASFAVVNVGEDVFSVIKLTGLDRKFNITAK